MRITHKKFFNLIEFIDRFDKSHSRAITLRDIFELHRDGMPFYFKFGSIITNEDPIIKDLGLKISPAKILYDDGTGIDNMQWANAVNDKNEMIQYVSRSPSDVQVNDTYLHRNLGYLLESTDASPLIRFSPNEKVYLGSIKLGMKFKGSLMEGRYSTESINSPSSSQLEYNGKNQWIMINSFEVLISIKDCNLKFLTEDEKHFEYINFKPWELIPVVMEEMGIDPQAYQTTSHKYKKNIFDQCRKYFPDKFASKYSTFSEGVNCPFNKAITKKLIKKYQ